MAHKLYLKTFIQLGIVAENGIHFSVPGSRDRHESKSFIANRRSDKRPVLNGTPWTGTPTDFRFLQRTIQIRRRIVQDEPGRRPIAKLSAQLSDKHLVKFGPKIVCLCASILFSVLSL